VVPGVGSGDLGRDLVTDPAVAALAASPVVLVLLFAWGVGEAVALPVVPDVLLGWLALATPAALGVPTAAAIAGGVAGAVILAGLRRTRPSLVEVILRAQPGLGERGMVEARERLIRLGAGRGFAQVGPGLALKAYVAALVGLAPQTGVVAVARFALVNRVTRIVPVVAAFAALGLAAAPLGVPTGAAAGGYAAGWTLFYAVFWWRRRPSAAVG
jgi:hypothetical protein